MIVLMMGHMRRRFVMGNWKMNGDFKRIHTLVDAIKVNLHHASLQCELAIFPPFVYLQYVQSLLNNMPIALGAQNVYSATEGAYTGEISPVMLADLGCQFVLVGHSERRHLFLESNGVVAQKYAQVKKAGMTPVLCIGETLEDRNSGQTESVLLSQLEAVRQQDETAFQRVVIAYEPVWAIGTGQAATPTQVQAVHHMIRQYLIEWDEDLARETSILYGGSVTPENAMALFALEDVDGGLIGGASLDADRWTRIIQCIN